MTYDLLEEYNNLTIGTKFKDNKSGKEYIIVEQQGRKVTIKDVNSGKVIESSTSRLAVTLGDCEVETPNEIAKLLYQQEEKEANRQLVNLLDKGKKDD